MFKKLFSFLLAVIFIFSLNACRSTDNSELSSGTITFSATGDAEKMKNELDFKGETITIMYNGDLPVSDSQIAKAEKRFNVKLLLREFKTPLESELLTNANPEGQLYFIESDDKSIYNTIVKGYLADLNNAIKETGITLTEKNYSEFNTNVYNFNDKQWAIGVVFPYVTSTVIYNKKLLSDAGFNVQKLIASNKWTWDTVTDIGKKTTKRNKYGEITQWGIGIDDTEINSMILSNNGNIIAPDKDGKFVSQLNTENTKEALQQVYDWYHIYKVASSFSGGQLTSVSNAFIKKKVAVIFGSPKDLTTITEKMSKDDYGIAYLPLGPKADKYTASMTSGRCYVIPKAYQNMDVGLLLLADELNSKSGEDIFSDEWNKTIEDKDQYTVWYNQHFGNKVNRVWNSSKTISCNVNFAKIIEGTQNVPNWIKNNTKLLDTQIKEITDKYIYTGNLK